LATALLTSPSPEPRLIRPAGAPARRPMAGRLLLVTGVLVAVAATAFLVVFLVDRPSRDTIRPEEAAGLPGRPAVPVGVPAAGTPGPVVTTTGTVQPLPSATVPASDSAGPGVSLSPSSSSSGGAVPPTGGGEAVQESLTASYSTTSSLLGLLGYRMNVTVANPDPAAQTGWTLAVTLPRSSLQVAAVKGATAGQQGAVWTFTPDDTTIVIDGNGQVTISFEVRGATLLDAAPSDCRIDGVSCTS
ncbi:MAG TPA: hypothetical protein VN408_19300, partial [Actinoplanes sp.]|nr:hypothetical protein [Actinoplanes sp.]